MSRLLRQSSCPHGKLCRQGQNVRRAEESASTHDRKRPFPSSRSHCGNWRNLSRTCPYGHHRRNGSSRNLRIVSPRAEAVCGKRCTQAAGALHAMRSGSSCCGQSCSASSPGYCGSVRNRCRYFLCGHRLSHGMKHKRATAFGSYCQCRGKMRSRLWRVRQQVESRYPCCDRRMSPSSLSVHDKRRN